MKRFRALLKKELRELITLQMLLPLMIGSMVFALLGSVIGRETRKMAEPQDIYVMDLDETAASAGVISALGQNGFIIEMIVPETGDIESETNKAISRAGENDISLLILIEEGFEEGIETLARQEIKTYSIIRSFSITSGIGSAKVSATVSAINDHLSSILISSYSGGRDTDVIKAPVVSIDNTVIGNRKAQINPEKVTSFIMSQTVFIPLVMFIIIIFSSQMLGVSVASEKENKTLETLLSTPVSRLSLVTAKMVAAAAAALIMASVYLLGFSYYMKNMTGGALEADQSSQGAIEALGLSIGTNGYLLLGISIFLSILTALAAAMILGAFAEDVKKVQGLLAPLIFLALIPYLFSMFLDIGNSSIAVRLIVYLIPFSHTFLAAPNIFLGNYDAIYLGAAYQLAVFAALSAVAARIFSSDRILTLKLNLSKKKR